MSHLPFTGTYAIIFQIAWLTWLVPEVVGEVTQRRKGAARRRGRGSSVVLLLGIFIGPAAGFAFAFALPGATISGQPPFVFFIGIVFMLLGVALRWYAVETLGCYFTRTLAVQAGQSVVEVGPYRYVRHPGYSGTLLTLLGIGLTLTNWASLLAIMVCAGIGYGYRIHVEERFLQEELGQPYIDCMRGTRRLIPFVL